METTTYGEVPVVSRSSSRRGVVAAVVAVLAPLIVALLMLMDKVQVQSRQGQGNVTFGMPLRWVTQNQGSLDPPLPYDTRIVSPLEYPLSIDWLMLMLNVIIIGLVLGGAYLGLLGLIKKRLTI